MINNRVVEVEVEITEAQEAWVEAKGINLEDFVRETIDEEMINSNRKAN